MRCIWPAIVPLKWGKGAMNKKYSQPPECRKRKGMDSPPDPQKGMKPCGHLGFSPVRPMSDFWPTELQNNKFVLFQEKKEGAS